MTASGAPTPGEQPIGNGSRLATRYRAGDINAFADDFHRLLGRLVLAHSRLDFNIGLQLHWMGPYCDVDVSEYLDPLKTQYGQRLKKLRKLTMDIYEPAGASFADEFRQWFDQADSCRALRNDYVHGRWGVPGGYDHGDGTRAHTEGRPFLVFVPLHWDMRTDRPDDSLKMTLEEFSDQVERAEQVAGEYIRLIERHRSQTKGQVRSLR